MGYGSNKRFYIGTMSEYQLAKHYIQEGRGCTVLIVNDRTNDASIWSLPKGTPWCRKVQVGLSNWMRSAMSMYASDPHRCAVSPSQNE